MEKKLNISTTLSLPLDVVTQRDAILAVSGAGKSNAARAMAEEFFAAQLPFVALDPKGDWWGLRSGRDGSAKGGLDVVIFGGSHGDVPLERTGGAYVADLISKERLSSILDLSAFESKAAKKQFLYDFGQRLYQKNQDPLKLFCDECDEYLPQKPQKDELRLLSVYEDIVRKGRTKGLGITLITQRSAIVNKNVLTQVETLYAMRTSGPQDVKVVEEWMKYHGADRAMLSTLATLQDGEAWVWSPHYLKRMERFRFRLSHTFDSGATPTNHRSGSRRRAATLSDVNVSAIASKMAETIERAAAEDPRALKQRIVELEKRHAQLRKELDAPPRPAPASDADVQPWREWVGRLRAELAFEQLRTESATVRVNDLEAHVARLQAALAPLLAQLAERLPVWTPPKITMAELNAKALHLMPGEVSGQRLRASTTPASSVGLPRASNGAVVALPVVPLAKSVLSSPSIVKAQPRAEAGDLGEVKSGELRILGALLARGPLSRTRLALLTGYHHTAGGYATVLGTLRLRGWVASEDRLVRLTPEGQIPAVGAPPPLGGRELVLLWQKKLKGAASKLFAGLLDARGPVSLEELVQAVGYKSATAGNVSDGLKDLQDYALVQGSRRALELGEAREDFL